jgi:hypothetical protein
METIKKENQSEKITMADKLFRIVILITFSLVMVAIVGYFVMHILWALYHDLPPARADYVDYVNFIFTVITLIVGLVGIFSVYNSTQAKNEVQKLIEKTRQEAQDTLQKAEEKFDKHESNLITLEKKWETRLKEEIDIIDKEYQKRISALENQINMKVNSTIEDLTRSIDEKAEILTENQSQITDLPLLHSFLTQQASNLVSEDKLPIQKKASAVSIIMKIDHPSPLIRYECVLALSQVNEYEPDICQKLKNIAQNDPVPEIRRIAQAAIDASNCSSAPQVSA